MESLFLLRKIRFFLFFEFIALFYFCSDEQKKKLYTQEKNYFEKTNQVFDVDNNNDDEEGDVNDDDPLPFILEVCYTTQPSIGGGGGRGVGDVVVVAKKQQLRCDGWSVDLCKERTHSLL